MVIFHYHWLVLQPIGVLGIPGRWWWPGILALTMEWPPCSTSICVIFWGVNPHFCGWMMLDVSMVYLSKKKLGYQIIISLVSEGGHWNPNKISSNWPSKWCRAMAAVQSSNPHDPSLCEFPPDRQQAFALCRSWGFPKAMPSHWGHGGFSWEIRQFPWLLSPRLSHGLMSPWLASYAVSPKILKSDLQRSIFWCFGP